MAAQGYIGRAPGESSVIVARQTFTPTGITTNFTFASGYTVGYVDAYLNGVRLIEGSDYTATDGSVVGLTTHAQNGDVLELVVYKAFNVSNVTAATADFSVGGDLSVSGNTDLTGTLTVSGVEVQPGAAGTWASYDTNTGISTTKKVKIENNLEVTGVGTITGDLTVGGVLTYDDVTNVDSIGIITARSHVSIADSILHTGDTNTAIRFPAADTFTVETAGSERFRVESGGNIGIGTINPNNLLHVYGGQIKAQSNPSDTSTNLDLIRAQCGSNGNSLFSIRAADAADDNSNWDIKTNANEHLTFTIGGATERLRIESGGNIGIGTDNPTEKLHIFDRTSNGGLIHYDGAANSHFGLRIRSNSDGGNFESDFANGTTAMLDLFADSGTVSGGDFLVCRSQAAIPILLVRGNGRIGVGTAAPDRMLVVAGSDPIIRSEDTDAGNTYAEFKQISGSLFIDSRSNTSDGTIIFRGVGGGSATEKLRIRSTGPHLLLGTGGDVSYNEITETSSNAGLVIGSSSVSNGGIVIRTGNTGTGRIYFADNSGSDAGRNVGNIRYQHSDNTLRMSSGGSEAVVIDAGGNFNITGITTATQFDATSDVALKENIEVIDEPINKLSELKGVTFDWKAGGHSVGVIAQDVEKVLPTAVGGNKDQKTVNYNAIIGLLVESVKDQQKQIEELKSLLDK